MDMEESIYGFILNYQDPVERKDCSSDKQKFYSKCAMFTNLPSLFFKIPTPVRSYVRYLSFWMEILEWSGLYPVDICEFGFLKSGLGISCTLF